MLKSTKISNFILIIIFILLITMPQIIYKIFEDKIPIDNSENRKLSEKPEFTLENINTYSSDFENYYNDHLPFRSVIRSAWANFNFLLLESTSDAVLVGKNDGNRASTWLFYQDDTDGNPVKETQGVISFSEQQVNEITRKIKTSTEENKNLGIETYFAIIPNKENIYKEKFPDSVKIYEEETRVDKLAKYLQEECNLNNIIYPKEALNNAKKTSQIYYKQDSHWNDYGAFIGFKEILEKIEPEYENLDYKLEFAEEELIEGDLTKIVGIKNIFKDKIPKVEFLPNNIYTKEIHNTNIEITTCDNPEIDKTVMIVGDSYMSYFKQYFSKVYKTVIYIHRMNYGKYILHMYKPDIFICETVERYVDILPQIEL